MFFVVFVVVDDLLCIEPLANQKTPVFKKRILMMTLYTCIDSTWNTVKQRFDRRVLMTMYALHVVVLTSWHT